jgi:hypothetical protein
MRSTALVRCSNTRKAPSPVQRKPAFNRIRIKTVVDDLQKCGPDPTMPLLAQSGRWFPDCLGQLLTRPGRKRYRFVVSLHWGQGLLFP